MKLSQAYICLDCEEITDNSRQCRCSSQALYSLQKLVDRFQSLGVDAFFDSLVKEITK